jgi:hypothetical protein
MFLPATSARIAAILCVSPSFIRTVLARTGMRRNEVERTDNGKQLVLPMPTPGSSAVAGPEAARGDRARDGHRYNP